MVVIAPALSSIFGVEGNFIHEEDDALRIKFGMSSEEYRKKVLIKSL